ncbi:MAG: helix-turn-helix domain-containing protein, partial [Planctomycetota bacterium]|nr:helix-turn-helix domain-containing protein [Planctomycetota bacterium]
MELTREEMLNRFRARDAAYVGRFVTGVLTTGIYCLPTCSARKPLAKNVRFFDTPEEARRAGLRACKRCKPDDWYARCDPDRETLKELVARVRAAPGEFANVGRMARVSGFGATKLGALCRRHYHVTPRLLLARARVERACGELLHTRRRALDVALECGFESTSSFHANFRRETGLAPGDYRRMARSGGFVLKLPASYPIDATLESLGRDHDGRTERVRGSRIARALRLERRGAVLSMELRPGAARCHVASSRPVEARGMGAAHAAALRLLGLRADPGPFERQVGRRGKLAPL